MPRLPPEQDAELIANVVEKIKARLAMIKSRPIPPMTYVLAWADNRYVGGPDDKGEPQIDAIDGINATPIDNGMPCVVMLAADLGATGFETRAELAFRNPRR